MILFVSQSLGSFVSPTCASKSLSQLGGSHGSLPSTVYCRAGRTNLLLSEFWGIKPSFLALLVRGPCVRQPEQELLWLQLWWGALTPLTKLSPGLESWWEWGVHQVAPPTPPPTWSHRNPANTLTASHWEVFSDAPNQAQSPCYMLSQAPVLLLLSSDHKCN